jgi:hypothetical protein
MSQSRETKIDYFQVKYHFKSYPDFYIIDLQTLTSWKNRQRVIDYLSLYEWNLEFAVDGYLMKRSNSMNIFERKYCFFVIYLALKNNDKSTSRRKDSQLQSSDADTNEQQELVKFK